MGLHILIVEIIASQFDFRLSLYLDSIEGSYNYLDGINDIYFLKQK